jgi:hypothetical protein
VQELRAQYGVLNGAFAGVVGGLLVAGAAFTVFPAARLGGRWTFLNLAGATFDQGWARYDGFHWLATPYGLLVHIIFCLSLGVLITWASNRCFLWATLTGAFVAAGFWWLAQETWLPLLNPALFRAVPSSLMAAGHLTLGVLIGVYLDLSGRTVITASRMPPRHARRPSRRQVYA